MTQEMTEQNEALVIINHWNSLDRAKKIEFRDEVLRLTGLSYPAFYYKLRCPSKFTRSEIYVINSLIAKINGTEC